MIDVSYQSIQCGMVRMLMKELKELLDFLPKYVYDELHSLLIRKLSDSDFVLAY